MKAKWSIYWYIRYYNYIYNVPYQGFLEDMTLFTKCIWRGHILWMSKVRSFTNNYTKAITQHASVERTTWYRCRLWALLMLSLLFKKSVLPTGYTAELPHSWSLTSNISFNRTASFWASAVLLHSSIMCLFFTVNRQRWKVECGGIILYGHGLPPDIHQCACFLCGEILYIHLFMMSGLF